MADRRLYVQGIDYSLAGSGCTLTAVSITLSSMTLADGVTLVTMANFGTLGYMTLEPETEREENISFTGITQNANGTATLTGVTRGLGLVSPYTAVAANRYAHAGGTRVRITNSAPFYNDFANKENDETITQNWTYNNNVTIPLVPVNQSHAASKDYVDSVAIAGAPNASTIVKGIVEIATQAEYDARTGTGGTGAVVVIDPTINRTVLDSDYVVAGGVANTYTATLVPAITSYRTGQKITVQIPATNTGASTINVNALGAKSIVTNVSSALISGELVINSIVELVYDGVNFQITSSSTPGSITGRFTVNADETKSDWFTWEVPVGLIPGSVREMAQWTQSGGLNTIQNTGGFVLINTNANSQYSADIPGEGTTTSYANNKDVRIKMYARMEPQEANDTVGMALVDVAGNVTADETNNARRIGLVSVDATGEIWAVCGDNVGVTAVDVSASANLLGWNLFEIVYNAGVEAKFYINGALATTINTNLPTGTLIFSIGVNDVNLAGGSRLYISPVTMSLEM